MKFTSPTIEDQRDSSAFNAAFVATESLLGEQILDNWIGGIEIVPSMRAKRLKLPFGRGEDEQPRFFGLDRLRDTVTAVMESIRDQLPSKPHHEWVDAAKWTMWELKPREADDYPGQSDLFVGTSANPAQWTAAHSHGLFCSERFSSCGETFCYVKLDGSEGLGAEGFSDRSEIEDALNAVLKPDGLGCHIGGGTGLRYSYIELALTDVDRGAEIVRRRLQAGRVPNRSWILFHDGDLAAEWVGVYDDTPAPPLAYEQS